MSGSWKLRNLLSRFVGVGSDRDNRHRQALEEAILIRTFSIEQAPTNQSGWRLLFNDPNAPKR